MDTASNMNSDSPDSYGAVTKAFHWGMALLIGWQLLKFGDRIAEGEHWIGQTLVPWHVSIGSLLLVLIVARVIWTISQRGQHPPHDPAMRVLIKAGHGLLYAGLILMPLTGIMVMIGGGHGLTAFGIQLIAKGEKIPWAQSIGSLHSPIAWVLAAMIIGHIVMALFHHFIKRDGTLKRML